MISSPPSLSTSAKSPFSTPLEPALPSRTGTSAPARRVDFLDQWRGVAVLSVFVYHCFGMAFNQLHPPWWHWLPDFRGLPKSYFPLFPASWGWAGVSIFFVISGFCIHFNFRQRPNWRTFFRTRFFRIYPPYALAFLFFALLYPVTRLQLTSIAGQKQILTHLLLIHNFDGTYTYTVSGVFWSIAVEAQLYLLYPLLIALVNRIGWRNALIVLATIELSFRTVDCVIFSFGNALPPEWIMVSPLGFWYSWAIGAVLAEAYINRQTLPFLRWSPIGLALVGGACILIKPLFFMSFLVVSLATAAALARALEGGRKPAFNLPLFVREHLRKAGLWSYSIYLLHHPLLLGVMWFIYQLRIFGSAHPVKIFALTMVSWVPIAAISALYFRFCEKPSVQLGKTLGKMPLPTFEPRPLLVTPDAS